MGNEKRSGCLMFTSIFFGLGAVYLHFQSQLYQPWAVTEATAEDWTYVRTRGCFFPFSADDFYKKAHLQAIREQAEPLLSVCPEVVRVTEATLQGESAPHFRVSETLKFFTVSEETIRTVVEHVNGLKTGAFYKHKLALSEVLDSKAFKTEVKALEQAATTYRAGLPKRPRRNVWVFKDGAHEVFDSIDDITEAAEMGNRAGKRLWVNILISVACFISWCMYKP